MFFKRHSLIVLLAAMFCSASMAMAGDRIQDRTKDQDRLMDGSCQDDATDSGGWKVIAADQDRDRKRDGSCQDDATDSGGWKVVAADRDRDRIRGQDRLRDGSCKG